jgi:hypothetical protein
LRVKDIVKLSVAIPSLEGEDDLLALPLTLPMGWTQSPPTFCAVTETIADVANQRLRRNGKSTPHRLDAAADSPSTDKVEDSQALLPTTSTSLPNPTNFFPSTPDRYKQLTFLSMISSEQHKGEEED